MGVRDLWHNALVYFGLAEDESFYDDFDEDGRGAHDDLERTYSERPNVRRIKGQRGKRDDAFDDIYSDDEPTVVPRRGRSQRHAAPAASSDTARDYGSAAATATSSFRPPADDTTTAVRVHVIQPRSFNDAQQIADRFKASIPVIINLQTADAELSKRLIDFGSGLTYALNGGMQRIAEKVFLLTPKNVEVSAEDRARLIEQQGFFNQA